MLLLVFMGDFAGLHLEYPFLAASLPDFLASLQAALVDRYRIERELGRGGMATVYLAQDLKHGRLVAIKLLRHELAFFGRSRFTAGLQHPHILPLLDSGALEDPAHGARRYYVMPYVQGESLRGHLRRERQLPIAEAVRIARDVAAALGCAHERGVVHRDINPRISCSPVGRLSSLTSGSARRTT